MTEAEMRDLHINLGFGFSLYTSRHLDSPLLDDLTQENLLVFQTDDPEYNAHELRSALRSRANDDEPERPITLIYVPVQNPPVVDDSAWPNAKVLATFIMKPVQPREAEVAV